MVGVITLILAFWMFEPLKSWSYSTNLLQEALSMVWVIQDRLRIAQSRHQSYAYYRCNPLCFDVGNQVLLWVLFLQGVIRFCR